MVLVRLARKPCRWYKSRREGGEVDHSRWAERAGAGNVKRKGER